MTQTDPPVNGRDDRVVRAAETALGLCQHPPEPALDTEIARWEADLTSLVEALPEKPPDPAVWGVIAGQLTPKTRPKLLQSVRLWRSLAAVSFALALLAWLPWHRVPLPAEPGSLFVATLRNADGAALYTASYDSTRAVLVVVPLIPSRGQAGIWLVRAGHDLVALGTLTPGVTTRLQLGSTLAALAQLPAMLTVTTGDENQHVSAHGTLIAY